MNGWRRALAVFLIAACANQLDAAQRIVLRSGQVLIGDVEMVENRVVLSAAGRRLHFSPKCIADGPAPVDADTGVRFTLTQPVAKNARVVETITRIRGITPFDQFGRRTVTIDDPAGRELAIHQGVTAIHTSHVVLRGLNRTWTSSLALAQVPDGQLLLLLRQAAGEKAGDQKRIIQFLIDAQRFAEAERALKDLRARYPSEPGIDDQEARLLSCIADQAIRLARRSLENGAIERARKLLQPLTQPAIGQDQQAKRAELLEEIGALEHLIDEARSLLVLPEASTRSPDEQSELGRAVSAIRDSVRPATLARLGPMRALAGQSGNVAEARLALALSGWVLGPELAQPDLARALALYRQAERLRKALFADEGESRAATKEALTAKIPTELSLQMISLLPAPTAGLSDGKPIEVTVAHGELESRFLALLPPGYDPCRPAPALVALHSSGATPERELAIWGHAAAERGYLVIAPEYRRDTSKPYEYSISEHQAMLTMVYEARRKLAIDPHRVFLVGHEMGAFAAWDFGMAHPDLFAGVAPIAGAPLYYCKHYWPNLASVAVYAVEGSLNGGNPPITQNLFLRLLSQGYDAIFVDYSGRGRETFAGEIPAIFDWADCHRRRQAESFEAVSARLSDREFFGVQIDDFLPRATAPPELFEQTKFRPARIQSSVTHSNQWLVSCSGIARLTLMVSPKALQLDDPVLGIRVNRKVVHKGLHPVDLATVLREARRTGDRQRLVAGTISVQLP